MENYDSEYEIQQAILGKLGGDATKDFDSPYEIQLEILDKISTGGVVPEAPIDGKYYARKDGDWAEIDGKVKLIAVDELPEPSADTMGAIYLVPKEGEQEGNIKDEYVTINNDGTYAWEKIGDTEIDLSDYYTKEETDEKFDKPYDNLTKRDDYLYEVTYRDLDYDYAEENMEKFAPAMGGCSTVRKGNIYGRNYDWYYDNCVSLKVRTKRNGKRVTIGANDIDTAHYETFGIMGGIPSLNKETILNPSNDIMRLAPFYIVDGMNEKGLVANVNIVPVTADRTTASVPTAGKLNRVCGLMLVRFILDNFSTAYNAVNYIKEHVEVFMPANSGVDQEMHFMVADATNTYILEFKNNAAVYFKVGEGRSLPAIMSNFRLDGVTVDADNHVGYTGSGVEEYGQGLERYNLMADYLADDAKTTSDDMLQYMGDAVRFTNAYRNGSTWKTEFVGGDLKIDTPIEEFAEVMAAARQAYLNRSRDERETWQTVHTIVYDLEAKTAKMTHQEYDYAVDDDSFGSNVDLRGYYTKEETDEKLEEKQDTLTAGANITIEDNVISASGVQTITIDPEDPTTLQSAYLAVYTAFVNGTAIPQIRMANGSYIFDVKILAEKNGILYGEAMYSSFDNDHNFLKTKLIISPTSGLQYVADNMLVSINTGLPSNATEGSIVVTETQDDVIAGAYIREEEDWKRLATEHYADEKVATKQDKLTAGDGITIENNVISATGGVTKEELEEVEKVTATALYNLDEGKQDKLTAGENITIEDNVISATGGGGDTEDIEDVTATAFADLNTKVDTNNTDLNNKVDNGVGSVDAKVLGARNYAKILTDAARVRAERDLQKSDEIAAAGVYYAVKSEDDTVKNIIKLTQEEYDDLDEKDAKTLYVIVDE